MKSCENVRRKQFLRSHFEFVFRPMSFTRVACNDCVAVNGRHSRGPVDTSYSGSHGPGRGELSSSACSG